MAPQAEPRQRAILPLGPPRARWGVAGPPRWLVLSAP